MKRLLILFAFLFVVNLFAQNSGGGFAYVGGDNLVSASVTTTDFGGVTVTRFNLVQSSPIVINPAGRWDIPLSSSVGVSKILIDGTSPMGGRVVKIAVATNNAQAVSTQRISTSPGSAIGTLTFSMNPSTVVVNSLSLYVAYEPSQQNPNATENTFLLKSVTFQDASGNNIVVYTSPGNGVVIPSVPTLGAPADGTTITLPYTFNWNAVLGATSYTFQLDTDQNFSAPITIDQTVTTASYTVLNLPVGTYYWHVKANNSAGSSAYTTTRSVIVNTGITIPIAPTLISPANGAANQATAVQLDWSDVTGATSYRVQFTLANGTVVADQSNLSVSTFQVSGLQNNIVYYWRANATNATGTSDWSQTWSFTTLAGVVIPAIPTLVSPVNGAANQAVSLLLDWNDVVGATSYRARLMLANGTIVSDQSNLAVSQMQVSGLQNNVIYYWQVNATNATGTSDWSQTWDFVTTTGITIPAVPTLISPINNSTGAQLNQMLNWASVSGAVSYDVQVSISSDFLSSVFSQNTSSTSIAAQNLQYAKTYYWRVCARNSAGAGSWSQTWNFMTYALTGIDNEGNVPIRFDLLQNYPNPFNPTTVISYRLPVASNIKIVVYDILGKEVALLVDSEKAAGKYQVSFNASNLSAGLYFYTIQAGEFKSTKKMILMK